jgi:WD40 repeat protein
MSYFANLNKLISPGSFIGSRVAIQGENHLLYATGNEIFQCAVEYGEITNQSQTQMNISPKSIPTLLKHEIQHVVFHKLSGLFGAIDASGTIQIFNLGSYKEETEKKSKNYDVLGSAESTYGSNGPANLAFSTDARVASSRFFHKDVTIYDQDKIIRQIHCGSHPTALKWMKIQNNEQLVYCDYNRLMMIDDRGKSPTVIGSITSGCLYSLANSSDVIATAGEDRTVYIFDIRNTNSVSKWDNCLKYSISYLDVEDAIYFVGSYESTEFRFGKMNSNEKVGFSADSRWIGLDRRGNMIAGVSERGKVYIKNK